MSQKHCNVTLNWRTFWNTYFLHVPKLHIVATGISAGVTSSAVKHTGVQVTTSPESQGSLEENKKMLQVKYLKYCSLFFQ